MTASMWAWAIYSERGRPSGTAKTEQEARTALAKAFEQLHEDCKPWKRP